MTPNEIKIFKIVEAEDKVSKREVAALLGISTDYAGYVLERLANGGYLAMVGRGIYGLSPKGVDVLLSQLYFAENKLEMDIARCSMERERIKKEVKRLSARKKNAVPSLT